MDPTVVAVPGYFATMGAEAEWLKRRAERDGPSAADYERHDTITSLSMGVASLVAPLVLPKLLGPFTPGKGQVRQGARGDGRRRDRRHRRSPTGSRAGPSGSRPKRSTR